MSGTKRCKSCGNPVELDQAKAHDGACPWCLAAFTFGPEQVGNPVTASKDPSKQFGKYVRTEKLGAGGMGEVWKALDTELNRWVALKFLKDDDVTSTARFQREARTAAGLSHSGIAAIHEVGEIEGRHYIAMQCVQGRTLGSFPKKDRRLLVRLFRDAARALEHAHRHGVIHRDLKPENLIVEEREDGWHVVILDFGLARPIEGGDKLSKSGEVYGTAAYMSPEQAKGDHLDERADVYSLGATMYDVLTGRPPFRGPNLLEVIRKVEHEEPQKLRKINPRIHRDLETIVLKCLEKDRERRYPNARELAEDLDRFLNSDPILARPPSTLYRLTMKLGKRKAIACAIGIAVMAVASILWLWTSHWKPQQDQARLFREGMSLREELLKLSMAPKIDRGRLTRRAVEARALFEEANARVETPEAHVMRGRCLQIEGKPAEALVAFERAHEMAPEDADAKVELARALLMRYRDTRGLHMRLWFRDRGLMSHEFNVDPETDAPRKLRERAERLLEERGVQGAKRELLLGLLAFGRGEYPKAAELLAAYNRAEGLDLEAMKFEFDARFMGQDLAGLIKNSDRLLTLAPDSTRWEWLGHARYQTGDLKGAIADYTRALELDPKDVTTLEARGFSMETLEDHAGALADFTRIIQLEPRASRGYAFRANVRRDLGDSEGAMADHNEAVRLNPRNSASYIDRGATRLSLGDYQGAIADSTEGLRIDPTQQAGYLNRGQARMKRGDFRSALEDFTKGLEYDPGHPTLYFSRGEVRLILNETAAGEDDLAKAVEVAGRTASSYFTRAKIHHEQGDGEKALPDYSKAIELNPRMGEAYVGRGRIHESRGAVDKADADFEKAIELNPKDIHALHMRGEMRSERGDLRGAVEDWTKSLAGVSPDQKLFRDHLEQHLAEAKEYGSRWSEFAEAKNEFKRMHHLHSEKEYGRAIEGFKRIAESFPKSETGNIAAYNVACGYALLGETNTALDWLEKSIDMGHRDMQLIRKDTDLDSLRGEPRFLKLMERIAPK